MKVVLLGKPGGITHWPEDIAADLTLSGHHVVIVPTRDPRLGKSVERALLSPSIGAPLARLTAWRAGRGSPDLLLAVGAFDQFPIHLFEYLAGLPGRPPLAAWIGDVFTPQAARIAALFDFVAYTDTGFVGLHDSFGFRPARAFVPLGATRAMPAQAAPAAREPRLAFVAAPTGNRRAVLAAVAEPVAVFGPGWRADGGLAHHIVDARRIGPAELARIYARYMGVLNIRHGAYVLHGLNQRHFAPSIMGAPVVSDDQPDIPHCFDPGTDMLVWRDTDELNALYAALIRDPARAEAIGRAGQRRVLAEHTYAHRLATIAGLLGLRC